MSRSADVVIAGGGIVGCACAYYLAKGGARVMLLDRGPLGSGASKAGMSHVVTWEEPEAHLALARASQRLYETLGEALDADIEYRRTGSLAVVETDAGLQSLRAMVDRLQAWGLDCTLLEAGELRRFEPNLAPDLAGGACFPGDGMVNPLLTTHALASAARRHGAEIRTFSEVTGVEREPGGRITAVRAGNERIPTGALVIAAGAWSGALGRLAGIEVPILPRKGTLVVTAPAPEDLLRCKVVLSAGYMDSIKDSGAEVAVAANVQQVRNGNLLLGSTRQFAGFDLRVEPEVVRSVLARCARFVPAVRKLQAIRMWSGLRPYTPDLLPLIGASAAAPGVYFAAGHEGIGITEAPITGLLISQVILGQEPDLPLEPFSPDRFLQAGAGENNNRSG